MCSHCRLWTNIGRPNFYADEDWQSFLAWSLPNFRHSATNKQTNWTQCGATAAITACRSTQQYFLVYFASSTAAVAHRSIALLLQSCRYRTLVNIGSNVWQNWSSNYNWKLISPESQELLETKQTNIKSYVKGLIWAYFQIANKLPLQKWIVRLVWRIYLCQMKLF